MIEIHSFDLAVGHPGDDADRVDVALGPLEGHDVTRHALVLRELADPPVDLRLAARRPDAQVRGAVRTHNDLRAQSAQTGETDGTQHAGSKGRAIGGLDMFNTGFKI